MNAAAKMIHQNNVFSGQFTDIRISWIFIVQIVLLTLILASALGVIYTTNVYREQLSQLHQAKQKSHELQVQWGQLLLEQASLETPARVEQLARKKLQMTLPTNNQIYVLQIK